MLCLASLREKGRQELTNGVAPQHGDDSIDSTKRIQGRWNCIYLDSLFHSPMRTTSFNTAIYRALFQKILQLFEQISPCQYWKPSFTCQASFFTL